MDRWVVGYAILGAMLGLVLVCAVYFFYFIYKNVHITYTGASF